MPRFTVTPFLAPNFLTDAGRPDLLAAAPHVEGPTFTVDADNADEAAYEVYKVCNSAPGEMFCDPLYAEAVAEYRARRHRSLSNGDVVRLIVAGGQVDNGETHHFRLTTNGWEVTPAPTVA